MRTILTDAEREARQRARSRHSFSDAAYRHYDPWAEGFGGPNEWRAAADRLAGDDRATFTPDATGLSPADREALRILGLTSLPADAGALKSAFRRRCFATHPDQGGSVDEFRAVYAAFERLVRLLRSAA